MDMRLKEGRLVVLSFLILSHVFGETHGQDRIPFAGDTLNMPSAIVEVLRIPTPIERAPGTLVVFEESQLQNGVSADIEDVINTIPGVKMETRGIGGSRRIQMRSSGLRSPFAVRNIHMLCNGFVLTGAGGTSPVELWNPQWLNRLEVLLGPTGAIFGGGYGGALVATSLAPFDGLSNDLTLKMLSRISTTGRSSEGVVPVSFETGFSASSKGQSKDWSLNATWSENPGYRDQESNQRRNIEFHRRWKPQPHILHHVWTGLLRASWDLPGSITAEQALTGGLRMEFGLMLRQATSTIHLALPPSIKGRKRKRRSTAPCVGGVEKQKHSIPTPLLLGINPLLAVLKTCKSMRMTS